MPDFDVPLWISVTATDQDSAWDTVLAELESTLSDLEAIGIIQDWELGEPIKEK